jgi:hypothetical protein
VSRLGLLDDTMSFDLYLQSFHQGELAGISRKRLRTAFGPHLTEVGPDYWQLCYGDAISCDIDLTRANP